MQLQDKVAIVTGAATGIGRSIAILMAREGAAVAIDYDEGQRTAARAVVAEIEKAGGKALAIEADVTKEAEVKKLVKHTADHFGRLDILVNNAGVEEEHPFLDMPLAVWDWVIAVDLTGPWLCAQAAARQMVSQGKGGRIINISSVHEDMPMPTNAPYCAAKGGLRMLMRTIAVELAPHKITVNNIGPGAIDTDLDAPTINDPPKFATLLGEIPLGRVGQPSEIAGLAVYLASDAAAYVTGSTYFMDGGMLRQSGSL
ncbi:MAG: SDR family oxidoreductase [Chloroflexota bacterium]